MLSLGKEAECAVSEQVVAPIQQLGQSRERPRCHDIDLSDKAADRILDAGLMHPDARARNPDRMAQERAFAAVAFDEVDLTDAALRQTNPDDKARKPPSRSKIEPAKPVRGEGEDLE